jgi:hypothetical protein
MFVKGIISNFTSPKRRVYKEGFLLPVMSAETLLAAGRHQAVLRQLKEVCGLPEAYYHAFYIKAVNHFVEFVQVLPTEFDGPLSGLMNEGIARAMIALQTYHIAHAKEIDPLKSYAVFTAALFQDVSHVLMNQRVVLTEKEGAFIDNWNPLDGAMVGKSEYYRMIRLGSAYQRLDFTLRHLLARQLMPEQGYQWIASDLHLLADWFDAINGDDSQGGVLASILSIMNREDVHGLQDSLVQVSVEQTASTATEYGQAFYTWLKERIEQKDLIINSNESGVHIVDEGLFIERPKVFREFVDTINAPVTIAVVYAQFGNLMGIAKKGGYDFMNAQYFSEQGIGADTGARAFSSPIVGKHSSLRDGMVLADPSMVLQNAQIPAVTPLMRAMQAAKSDYLPAIKEVSSSATPRPDPTKR